MKQKRKQVPEQSERKEAANEMEKKRITLQTVSQSVANTLAAYLLNLIELKLFRYYM